MKKNEKIIAICLTFSIFLMIFSSIYTIYKLKPVNKSFAIEKLFGF